MLGLGLASQPEETEFASPCLDSVEGTQAPKAQNPQGFQPQNWPFSQEQTGRPLSQPWGQEACRDGVTLFTSGGVQQKSQGQARGGTG